MKNTQQNS